MTFKTEAEVYRYLLEKEGNVVEHKPSGVMMKFISGSLYLSVPEYGTWDHARFGIYGRPEEIFICGEREAERVERECNL